MSPITKYPPNTILLAGMNKVINDLVASEAITPGDLIEKYSDSGVLKWRKNASASEIQAMYVALEQDAENKTIDDAYAAGDLVIAYPLAVGDVFYGRVLSGQDISVGELLKSAGDGTLQTVGTSTAAANLGHFQSNDELGAVTTATRLRVERIN